MDFSSVAWPLMWEMTDAEILVDELKREISSGHVLYKEEVSVIARRGDCDDVLYFLTNKNNFAVVHLTWANQPENPPWPSSKRLMSLQRNIFPHRNNDVKTATLDTMTETQPAMQSLMWRGLIHYYREYLPVDSSTRIVTLHEGNTPLIHAPRLAEIIAPDCELYLKFEGTNPTGSFKDRGMTMAVTKAHEDGAQVAICASTGNTSASAAAYCAVAGIRCVVLLPQNAIALGKLAQALVQGATVLAVEGNFDDALRIVKELTANYPIAMLNSLNPYRIEGQKTGAFEICDFLGYAPDFHAIPVGNAGNITAYWKGYNEYSKAGKIDSLPKMLGFQARGSDPLVVGHNIDAPTTIATAIRIGHPARGDQAIEARDQSGGLIESVSDEEILVAQKRTASLSGIFGEPACAAPLAGITRLSQQGYFKAAREELGRKPIVVSVVTGHGLKDPNTAIQIGGEPTVVAADETAVLRAIGF